MFDTNIWSQTNHALKATENLVWKCEYCFIDQITITTNNNSHLRVENWQLIRIMEM